jgi:uncharacterized membrane protein
VLALLCVVIFTVILIIVSVVPVIGQIAALIGFPLMMFALMYIAFDDLEAIDAIKRVFNELFSGALLMPVLVGVLANLAGSLGVILCGVGILLTMPLIPAVFVCTYHQMKMDSDEILDADVVEPSEPFDTADVSAGETKPE